MPSRKLEIELIGDSSHLSRAFRGAVRESDTFGSRLRHAGVVGAQALGGAVVAGAAAATYGIIKSTEAAEESNKVHAQTGAVLKSTGGAANVTQKDVEGLSGAISQKTGIDDEQIQSGANILLTFKEIRNEVGEGNKIFDQSTQTIVDMSAALDQDLKSSAIQVGKALNDPIKGLTALQRVGVSFSEQKAEQIKQWVEEGDTLRAQKAILKELNSEFGGSAAAQATALEKIKVGFGNVEESVGNVFLPLVDEAATNLNQDLVPELQRTADGLAAISARKDLDLGEKLGLAGDVIKRDWGDMPEEIGHLIDEAVPVVAEHAGDLGVAWAHGMLNGFVHSDPFGKAAILLFASKAFGGPAAVLGAGRQVGSKFGGAAATESAAAMAAGFGLSSGGAKAFRLIDKTRAVGKTVGKAGLAVGIVSGLAAGLEDADSPSQHLQNAISNFTFGLTPPADGGWANQIADGFIEDWNDRLPDVQKHIHSGMLDALAQDRGKLVSTWKVAVATGASEERIDGLKGKIDQLDQVIKKIKGAGRSIDQGIQGLEGGKFTRLSDIKSVVAKDSKEIATRWGEGSLKARDEAARNFDAAADAIEIGMHRGVISTKRGVAEIQRFTRQAHLVSGDDPWGIAKGFERSWEKAGSVTDQNLHQIQGDLGKMPPVAAAATGQMMINMAREMRQKGQLSKAEMERVRSAVVTKLGLMASQGGKKGELFEASLSGSFNGLSTDVAEALGNIGLNVSEVMKQLGVKGIPKFELQVLRNQLGPPGKVNVGALPQLNKARGGPVTVPGQGLHDTVGLAVNGMVGARVAPGEDLAVFTRHQRPLIDRAVANEYGVAGLPGFFNTFDRPHYMAKGGLHEPHLSGPDPLRSLGQAGIHKSFLAAQAYIQAHQPKGGGSLALGPGAGGFVGPPPSFQQLGNNAWVDSHTYQVASFLANRFGSEISSDWRSAAENAAANGSPTSSHMRGSAANPGAFDFVPPKTAMQAWVSKHIAGITENEIHDYGSGLHNHIAFFAKGGKIGGGTFEDRVRGAAGRIWNGAAHYFGRSPKSAMPDLYIASGLIKDHGMRGKMEAYPGGRRMVFLDRGVAGRMAAGNLGARKTLVHEWAHYFQKPGILDGPKWLFEGGAEAFARSIVPGGERLPYGRAYKPYTDRVIKEKGWPWIKHGQFVGSFAKGGVINWGNLVGSSWDNDELATLAHLVGAPNPGVMAQYAQSESGGDANATNTNTDGSIDEGLWQINSVHGFPNLRDPLANAEAMKAVLASQGMGAWYADPTGPKGKVIASLARQMRETMSGKSAGGSAGKAKVKPEFGLQGFVGEGKAPKSHARTAVSLPALRPTALLPSAEALPESIKGLLASPRLGYSGKVGISELALQLAEGTEDRGDDEAVLNFQEELFKRNKQRLQKALKRKEKELQQHNSPAGRKKLLGQRDHILVELSGAESSLAGVRGARSGLGEGEGETEADTALQEAIEANTRAEEERKQLVEEHIAAIRDLQKEMEANRAVAESEAAVGRREAIRAVADMISGELGARVDHQRQTAGVGTVAWGT